MKNFTVRCLFVLVLSPGFSALAQCPAGALDLNTQAAVDNFATNYPGCTHINGYLNITGNTITNLNGLSVITSTLGDVYVDGTSVTSLARISGLTSMRALHIKNNPLLTNLNGLPSLAGVNWTFWIDNNDALTSLTGAYGVTSFPYYLFISGNGALTTLTGLPALTSIGRHLYIENNNVLTSLSGLESLTSVGEEFKINNNAALTSLAGLSGLTSVGGNLEITANSALTTLTGVENLGSVGGHLLIESDNALPSLTGLSGLTSLGGYLSLTRNPALTDVTALAALSSVGGGFYINNNVALPSLNGLQNVNPATINDLYIIDSPVLSYCEIANLCTYLSTPANAAVISNNAPNCASRTAVINACLGLPIELASFTGRAAGKQNLLDWTTATETGNDHFDLERSANSVSFETIGTLQGAGSSHTAHRYAYTDIDPFNGVTYYRLKQVDSNGKFAYSDIISVKNTEKVGVKIYPNPAGNELHLDVVLEKTPYTIKNAYGQVVQAGRLADHQPVNIASLPSGLYYVCFDNQALKFAKR